MKSLPRISIVTISFNQRKFLERTLRSVLEQDYPNLEYIVVDGESTDGSLQIIEQYRSKLSKVMVGRDDGPSDALNKGFAQTDGEWLGFLNSDDTLLPGALHRLATEVQRRPEVDFFSGHCLITDANDVVLRKTYSDPYSVRRLAYDGCIILQAATFFRRALYHRSGGFNVQNRIAWDSELFLKFGLLGAKHGPINAFLATYRLHAESITGLNRVESNRQALRQENLQRYLGRAPGRSDSLIRLFYRYWRKLLNPRDTWQRIVGGRIGGRFASESA